MHSVQHSSQSSYQLSRPNRTLKFRSSQREVLRNDQQYQLRVNAEPLFEFSPCHRNSKQTEILKIELFSQEVLGILKKKKKAVENRCGIITWMTSCS